MLTITGIVVDNNDTEKKMNRVKVCIPEVMGGTQRLQREQHS